LFGQKIVTFRIGGTKSLPGLAAISLTGVSSEMAQAQRKAIRTAAVLLKKNRR
jgi:hypothetical protein